MKHCDVAIIGAGPYGLSIAAHLRAAQVDFRIFGSPMEFWLKHMPEGMHLKSEGFASSLYDPEAKFELRTYCSERGVPYADTASPVPLEVFTSYGLEFQKRFVPEVEDKKVVAVRPAAQGFEVTLDDGEVLAAGRVVVAVGLTYYKHVPQELEALPADLMTHSSVHRAADRFTGRHVAIMGAGASAIDLAALLHEAGASVEVIARGPSFRFQDPPTDRENSWLENLRNPATGIGPGWKLWMCAKLPLLFRQMPDEFRLDKVRRVLGPAPCWFTKEQVVGKVALHAGMTLKTVKPQNGRAVLEFTDASGTAKTITADHVIAATGYRPDVNKLAFLDPALVGRIRTVGNTPRLSSHFESSVPDLYFVGISAANTFGPLLRFAYGAGFAAPRLSRHLARTASPVRGAQPHAQMPKASQERATQ